MDTKIAIIAGTRPEIIKMSPIIRYCVENNIDYFVMHTGQHYSYNMEKLFYLDLGLGEPKFKLGITSKSPLLQSDHTGRMLIGIEDVIIKEKPNVVLVQGDTNTVLAASLCARKLVTSRFPVKLGHVEAGLRSYDRGMPEEINRIISDHISDYLFAPTETAKQNMLKESIPVENIHVTGNTIVDALNHNVKLAKERSNILEKLELEKNEFMLITSHRPENVDVKQKLQGIMDGLRNVYDEFKIPMIYPMHPRTKKMLEQFNMKVPDKIKVIDALGYMDFLQLLSSTKLVLTDSGGIQEEACVLKVPCVTMRENTERPETIEIKSNILTGTDPDKISDAAKVIIASNRNWNNPYGDGDTSEKIIKIVGE
ncbi:non-hydrolyzing UDP-N-acetylglucosamine 2-epimerase [Candidatus Aenigmatarchaeota archaeon]